MKNTCLAGVAALVFASPLTAFAQTAAARPDPLSCGKTRSGDPILLGSTVKDLDGRTVGAVSMWQCSPDTGPNRLSVRLSPTLGGTVRLFDLSKATVKDGEVVLGLTPAEVASLKAARPEG